MCRFRPISDTESLRENGSDIIHKKIDNNGTLITHPDREHHPHPITFYFDKIFNEDSIQQDLFEDAAKPLIDNIFEGYNATIFAYGQTGCFYSNRSLFILAHFNVYIRFR